MFRSTPHITASDLPSLPLLVRFLGLAMIFAVAVGFASILVYGAAALPLAVFLVIVSLTAHGLMHSYPHAVLGACNALTLARAAMVAFLSGALIATDVSAYLVFAVAIAAFGLDGVDGWLARRAGLTSDFGARFDMETDAALAAVLSLWLWVSGTVGPEILILGLMRYGFVAASWVWPVLQAPLPEAFRRKAICVVQIGALILLACPLTPAMAVAPVAVFAAILLSWSFLVDILWLARRAA